MLKVPITLLKRGIVSDSESNRMINQILMHKTFVRKVTFSCDKYFLLENTKNYNSGVTYKEEENRE